jgi:hypothetical protein
MTLWVRTRRWVPNRRVARRSSGPLLGGVWLRCVTRWHARRLDRQLAAGVDPMQSDELSLRVAQLGSSKTRRRVACALRGVVALAERGPYPIGIAALPIRRAAVHASSELLLEIADRLGSREPLGIRGVAIALQLIEERRGPLYRDNADRPLTATAFEALVALDRGLRTVSVSDD